MEKNRNWQGWAALLLAGLALLVALGGRDMAPRFFAAGPQAMVHVQAVPTAQPPGETFDPRFQGEFERGFRAEGQARPFYHDQRERAFGPQAEFYAYRHHGPPWFFLKPLMFLFGLMQLLGLGLLLWLLYRLFTQRRGQSPGGFATAPASPPPHDPRVE